MASRTQSALPFSQQATVEDYLSDDEWEDLIEEPCPFPDADSYTHVFLPTLLDMFYDEALRAGISLTGDNLLPNEAFIAFQEVPAGTTIMDAALWPQHKEMPSIEIDESADKDNHSWEYGV